MMETIKWIAIGYAAPVVIGVGAVVLWWRRINRQRAQAIMDMEARKAGRMRAPLRTGSGAPSNRSHFTARASAATSSSTNYEAPAPMPLPVDSWLGAVPAESHHSSYSGGGGTFDGGGASGDWGGSSSDSSSSYSSSDSGSSSSDSGSCGGSD